MFPCSRLPAVAAFIASKSKQALVVFQKDAQNVLIVALENSVEGGSKD